MDNFTRLWNVLLNGVPDIVAAVIIILVAFLSATIVKSIISKLMKFLKFDYLLKKAGIEGERAEKTAKAIWAKLWKLIVFSEDSDWYRYNNYVTTLPKDLQIEWMAVVHHTYSVK